MNTNESCLTFIAYALALALIFGGTFVYKYFQCHSKAKTQGLECSWGPIQGCMVKMQDGTWMDYDRLRYME